MSAALLAIGPLPTAEASPPVDPEHRPVPELEDVTANLVLPPRHAAAVAQVAQPAPPPPPAPVTARRLATDHQRSRTASRPRRTVRSGDVLARIRQCESGGNYTARSASGTYGGAYQFDRRTFASVGGTGDPATATQAEQDYRARLLFQQRGGSPWPVCSSQA